MGQSNYFAAHTYSHSYCLNVNYRCIISNFFNSDCNILISYFYLNIGLLSVLNG